MEIEAKVDPNDNKVCQIVIRGDGCNEGLVLPTKHNHPLYAAAFAEKFRRDFGDAMKLARRKAYEQGVRDGRGHRQMKTGFSAYLSTTSSAVW
jgi:hypothetical protein